jgi:hypothetical protein
MKPVRNIVSSKQTTETEGRRVLNQNFCGCLLLLYITYRSEGRGWGQASAYLCESIRVILHNQQAPTPKMDAFNCRGIAVVFHAVGEIN